MDNCRAGREMMKSNFMAMPPGTASDQQKGLPPPPIQHEVIAGQEVVALDPPSRQAIVQGDVYECIARRRSRRRFAETPMSLQQLSLLLWATAGIQRVVAGGAATMRTVPSAGARHPIETYLAVRNVEGLAAGLWRYQPVEHALARLGGDDDLASRCRAASLNQAFAAQAAVVFIWTCVPYRGEWRYLQAAHKPALLDAGHVAQNLYIACEAVGCGTCAIAAYDQQGFDKIVGVDGQDEFVIYLAAVGPVEPGRNP